MTVPASRPPLAERALSARVRAVPPSGIRRFFDIAAEMDDVISLGVGEPDFVTPWRIREAGIPILGALFKSRSENRTKTELVIMVTPEITAPVNAADLKALNMPKEMLPLQMLVPAGAAASPAAPPPERGRRGKKK